MKSISLCQVPSLYNTQSSSKWFPASRLDGFFISSFTSFTWIQLLKTWTFCELIWRTTKQESLWHFNWKSMWHLSQLSVPHHLFYPRCHLRPLRVMYDHQMTRDTCLLSPSSSVSRPPTLSSIISRRYLTSWTLSNSPPPLSDAWCLNSCQFGKFSIDERVAWVFTSNLIFNSCNFIAPHCSPLPGAPQLREMRWRTKNSRDKQNSHE